MKATLSNGVLKFIGRTKPRDHNIFFYDSLESKHLLLSQYLNKSLENNNAAIYICSAETPDQIRDALKYLMPVDDREKEGRLQIKSYDGWYFEDGRADAMRIIGKWKSAYEGYTMRGMGLRVSGDTTCFFVNDMVRDLMRYEYALHRFLDFPFEALCAYNIKTIVDTGYTEVIMPLMRAHGNALFLSHGGSVILEPEDTEDTDIEELLNIEI
ncbi:MEDS domain-containing protein [Candidatus Bathyarchaeota archaeon]|nr:MEDS domain-containing protein [Candidatus Bathyarchaeota archaeon]